MKLKNNISQTQRLYNCPFPLIGLTGGIATGKSTVSKLLEGKDFFIICADELIKKIYQMDEALDFVKQNYPQVVESKKINFSKLRELAFNNPEVKNALESFLYPHLKKEFLNALDGLTKNSIVIYDVPLLFERNLDEKFDLTVCVYAPEEIQIERLMHRDSIDKDLAQKILSQQFSIEEKKQKAQFTIDNTSDLKSLNENIDKLLSNILA